MKRTVALLSLFVVCMSMMVGCDFYNQFGKDQYYLQITADGKEKHEKSDSGQPMKRFEYKISAFDKDGEEKEVEFTSHKNLRKKAFLQIYHSDEKGVTSWVEVKKEDIPTKAKEKLGIK